MRSIRTSRSRAVVALGAWHGVSAMEWALLVRAIALE